MKVKRGLYESVIVPTALCAAETWGMKTADKKRLEVMEKRCLRSMCGVTKWDKLRKEEIHRRTGVLLELSKRAEHHTDMGFTLLSCSVLYICIYFCIFCMFIKYLCIHFQCKLKFNSIGFTTLSEIHHTAKGLTDC